MQNNYLIWHHKYLENMVVLSELDGFEEDYQLNQGIPLLGAFPDDAVFDMDPERPNNMILQDSLYNTDNWIVGSLKLKKFLEAKQLKNVEYLPVRIHNHKGKFLRENYFFIHPIHPVDCLDVKKSGARFSKIIKTNISEVKRLIINESELDPDRLIFRLKHFYDIVLVRRDLAEAIDQQDFTGIRWLELNDYPGD